VLLAEGDHELPYLARALAWRDRRVSSLFRVDSAVIDLRYKPD
jgi:hypothetical protein